MEIIKNIMLGLSVVPPLYAGWLLQKHFTRERQNDWKSQACLCTAAIAASLILLLASGHLLFLRYGEAVLQVDQKVGEVRKLTEQNKRLAVMTANAIISGLNGAITDPSHDERRFQEAMVNLLKAADVPAGEIDQILGRTNSRAKH
jgi:hypothetical protein